jgi:hypothetical protein
VANENRSGLGDIPPTAGMCFVMVVVGIIVAIVTDAPVWVLVGLVSALAAVAFWIRRAAG